MRLEELEPEFLATVDDRTYRRVDTLPEADGIIFVCPKCWAELGQRAGAHSVICWFRGKVPDSQLPGPGRWTPVGTGFHDLSFVHGEPSINKSVQLTGGCMWHATLTDGLWTDA